MLGADDSRAVSARTLFLFISAVYFLMAIGNIGLVAVMPAVGRLLAIPDYLIACTFSFSAFVWAFSSPFWTARVERYGAALCVRAGLAAFIASMAGFALAIVLALNGLISPFAAFLLFFVLRAVFGLFGAGAATATQALVALRAEGAQRARVFAEIQGANSLGQVVGPAIAPFMIVAPFGHLGPMLGFSVFGVIALAMSFFALTGPSKHKKSDAGADTTSSIRAIWADPAIGRHLTFGMTASSAQAINLYTIGFVILDRCVDGACGAPDTLIGGAMAGGALAAVLAQFGVVRFLSPSQMMGYGALVALLGNLIPLVFRGADMAVLGFIAASFGFGLARPGFVAAASLAGERKDQVAIASAVSMIAGASIAAPPVIAALIYRFWAPAPFALPAILVAVLLCFRLPDRARAFGIVRHRQ